jgi:hypothetical protein
MDKTNKIRIAQQILNYQFRDEDLLWEALQAHGSNVNTLKGRPLIQGNKGLAGLGNVVITLVIKLNCYMMNRTIGIVCIRF